MNAYYLNIINCVQVEGMVDGIALAHDKWWVDLYLIRKFFGFNHPYFHILTTHKSKKPISIFLLLMAV
jgi:hypothetical protein